MPSPAYFPLAGSSYYVLHTDEILDFIVQSKVLNFQKFLHTIQICIYKSVTSYWPTFKCIAMWHNYISYSYIAIYTQIIQLMQSIAID